jgi:hypothetical protein
MTWARVNQPEEVARVVVADCCSPHTVDRMAPLDVYLSHAGHVLTLGSNEELENSATLGRLLLLGLMTGVETYFRTLLAGALKLCPLAQRAAADQMLSYGSIQYYPRRELEAALFEQASFSSAKEIRRMTEKTLGIDIGSASSLMAAVAEYERACQLRHAAVHSHGVLTSANASAVGVAPNLAPATVTLEMVGLHGVARVCHSMARAFNQEIYERLVARWIAKGVLSGVWGKDKARFSRLHELFASTLDHGITDARAAYAPVAAAARARALDQAAT